VRHLGVVVVNGAETGLVLQTEDKNDCVYPSRELQQRAQCKKAISRGLVGFVQMTRPVFTR
jgi:hypothetical protein